MLVWKDLTYDKKTQHTCDVYLPNHGQKTKAVVFLVHGGAWMVGDKSRLANMAVELCEHCNVVCVIPEYSLSKIDPQILQSVIIVDWALLIVCFICLFQTRKKGNSGVVLFLILFFFALLFIAIVVQLIKQCHKPPNQHPAHVRDVAKCVDFIVNQSSHLNVDASKIVLLGHSAGAHLCALLSLHPKYLSPVAFRAVVGVICISGLYSFWRMQDSLFRHFLNAQVFPGMFTQTITNLEALKEENIEKYNYICDAWPMFHVESWREHKPKFLILTSETDLSMLYHANDFVRLLQQNLFQAQHLHFEKTTHFSIRKYWNARHKHIAEAIITFLQTIL